MFHRVLIPRVFSIKTDLVPSSLVLLLLRRDLETWRSTLPQRIRSFHTFRRTWLPCHLFTYRLTSLSRKHPSSLTLLSSPDCSLHSMMSSTSPFLLQLSLTFSKLTVESSNTKEGLLFPVLTTGVTLYSVYSSLSPIHAQIEPLFWTLILATEVYTPPRPIAIPWYIVLKYQKPDP